MTSVPCPEPPPTTRRCLRCDAAFPSAGPQNRLCRDCRVHLASGPSPEPMHVLGRGKLRVTEIE
jgi:hypothetical protein